MLKINAHSHLLPYPEQIPAFMREKEVFWVDEARRFMCQGSWRRPVTDPSFFLQEKLAWMDRNGLDRAVVLCLSQLYCNGMERVLANDVVRFQNDFNAETQANHPDRFIGGFVVQPLHLDDALVEIERCVRQLHLRVLCLPTHFLNAAGQWVTVAHPDVAPLWELANDLGLAIEIHPYDAEKMVALADDFWRFHLVWMCAQTADCYHFYTLFDFPERYPRTRVCFAHGNLFGQIGHGRRRQGFEGRPDLFPGAVHPDRALAAPNVFFDTLVHDPYALRLLADRHGTAQLLAGLDDPYPLGEMETVPGCYPGKVLDDAQALGFINADQYEAIWSQNIIRWVNGK